MNQIVTVAKVVGRSSRAVIGAFQRWSASRVPAPQEPTLAEPSQWPADCRDEMRQLASDLRATAARPPVVFYNEHVDMWSMGDVFRKAFPSGGSQLHEAESDDGMSVLCYAIADDDRLQAHLHRELSREHFAEETRWYLRVVQQAASAWHPSAQAAIVVVRQVVGGLVMDEEVEEASQATADWLRRYSTA
jgi:hypothetical protein